MLVASSAAAEPGSYALTDARQPANPAYVSCGPDALQRVLKDKHLEIEYDGSSVLVNGTRWAKHSEQGDVVLATTNEEGRTWTLLLMFRRVGDRRAYGSLHVLESGRGKFRCADAVVFHDGTYAK